MSLLVKRHMTEKILTFGFPGNAGYRLVSWDSIVRKVSKIISWESCEWGEASIVRSFFSDPFFFRRSFIHLSLDKVGPFTLESHMPISMLKPWKCKVFQIFGCLIKPLFKNNIQTIFQGGTPWVAQILNNITVWMAPYCAHQRLGPFFLN